MRSLYFKKFSASFLITFLSPGIASSINMHVPLLLLRIMMAGLLLGIVRSVHTCLLLLLLLLLLLVLVVIGVVVVVVVVVVVLLVLVLLLLLPPPLPPPMIKMQHFESTTFWRLAVTVLIQERVRSILGLFDEANLCQLAVVGLPVCILGVSVMVFLVMASITGCAIGCRLSLQHN